MLFKGKSLPVCFTPCWLLLQAYKNEVGASAAASNKSQTIGVTCLLGQECRVGGALILSTWRATRAVGQLLGPGHCSLA